MRRRIGAATALALASLVAGPVGLTHAKPTITARVQPNRIPLGQDARLEVTVSGATNAPTPRPAPVPGLDIQSMGQTMSMQFVNGSMTTEVTNTFLVRPTEVGQFEIPPIAVEVGGTTLKTRALTLHVVDAARVPQVERTRPGSAQNVERRDDPTAGADGEPPIALLEVTGVPARELFVGEALPIEIHLYVREGTRVTEASPPALQGSGFTLQRPSDREPTQQRVRLSDGVYTKLTFPAALSPITSGDVPLEASLDITARIPQKVPRQRRRFDDPFFDSFFDSFAYRAVEQKIPVESDPLVVRVSPLPEEGRPESFTGGVGRFSLEATAEPTTVAVGDPITLRVSVYGEGNFDRLQLPPVRDDARWKAYDPTAEFQAEDALGLSGRKSFEQALLPLDPETTELPARQLSYFDPEQKKYVTVAAAAIPIEVRNAPSGHRPRAVGRAAPAGVDAYELAPNVIELGTIRSSIAPYATRAWFLALPLLPIAAAAGAVAWGRRRRRLALDPRHARNKRLQDELRARTAKMDDAVRAGDAASFFASARRALQERVAALDDSARAESLTPTDIDKRLARHPELQTRVRDVFDAADALAYGGGQAPEELGRRRDDVLDLLRAIEKALGA